MAKGRMVLLSASLIFLFVGCLAKPKDREMEVERQSYPEWGYLIGVGRDSTYVVEVLLGPRVGTSDTYRAYFKARRVFGSQKEAREFAQNFWAENREELRLVVARRDSLRFEAAELQAKR